MTTERFIYSQGRLDGACFLYALANARRAIQGGKVSDSVWSSAVRALEEPSDFLDQTCGTTRTDHDAYAQEKVANDVLNQLSQPRSILQARSVSPISRESDFLQLLSKRTALIVSDPVHWYCIVDASPNRLYIACSWKLHDVSSPYRERKSGRLKRIYNHAVHRANLKVFQSRAFLVTK